MKNAIFDLAIMDGEPHFDHPLHVGRPNIGNRDTFIKRVNDILDRRWFTNNGTYVQEFEKRIAEVADVKHCIAMTNATIALEIAIRALDLSGEVIVPSFTFVATAHALQWQGITPVFCDVAPGSHHIDPAKIELMLTPQTTGIIGVHVWGEVCDVDALQTVASKHNLRLLYDAAHAIGSSHQGKKVGGFGDAEVFSFHATKFLNSFEGGAVVTNNDELAETVRFMRNFGFSGYDTVDYVGTNGKMTEVAAAMGLTSLESVQTVIDHNKHNYDLYQEHLGSMEGISLYQYNQVDERNYQYVVVEVDASITGINRDDIVRILHAENLLVRRYFYPGCHQMEPYRSYFPHSGLLLQETESLTKRVMSLPTGTAVTDDDIVEICNLISFIVDNGTEVGRELKKRDAS